MKLFARGQDSGKTVTTNLRKTRHRLRFQSTQSKAVKPVREVVDLQLRKCGINKPSSG